MNLISYKSEFFKLHQEKSLSSARTVIPLILQYIQPTSVLDVGCGNGTWLKAWQEQGVKNISGVDGSYINTDELLISNNYFTAFNLEEGFKKEKKSDLVTCLEVAEHIRPEFAETFIESLCSLSDVILFSAAIPGQEGTYHFNEQYPNYWVSLFKKYDFIPIDCIREKIWDNPKISWWYRQNILFFVKKEILPNYPELQNESKWSRDKIISLVHPLLFEEKVRQIDHLKKLLRNPIRLVGYFGKKMFKQLRGS
jgi:SAM-dependent methyltransferase